MKYDPLVILYPKIPIHTSCGMRRQCGWAQAAKVDSLDRKGQPFNSFCQSLTDSTAVVRGGKVIVKGRHFKHRVSSSQASDHDLYELSKKRSTKTVVRLPRKKQRKTTNPNDYSFMSIDSCLPQSCVQPTENKTAHQSILSLDATNELQRHLSLQFQENPLQPREDGQVDDTFLDKRVGSSSSRQWSQIQRSLSDLVLDQDPGLAAGKEEADKHRARIEALDRQQTERQAQLAQRSLSSQDRLSYWQTIHQTLGDAQEAVPSSSTQPAPSFLPMREEKNDQQRAPPLHCLAAPLRRALDKAIDVRRSLLTERSGQSVYDALTMDERQSSVGHGYKRYLSAMALLDTFSIKLSPTQRQFAVYILFTQARHIMGDDYSFYRDKILSDFNRTEENFATLLTCPRRFGKSTVVAIVCAILMKVCPGKKFKIAATSLHIGVMMMKLCVKFYSELDPEGSTVITDSRRCFRTRPSNCDGSMTNEHLTAKGYFNELRPIPRGVDSTYSLFILVLSVCSKKCHVVERKTE